MYSNKAFAAAEGYKFPVLSDFWPHGMVSKQFGVFNEDRGCATRGSFLIDKDGILRWSIINSLGEKRNLDEYKAALALL